MQALIRYGKIYLAFLLTIVIMCIINFLAQVFFIFIDVVSRFDSSSAFVLVLWLVTGVFTTIFTNAAAELFFEKKTITYPFIGKPVLVISIVAILIAIFLIIGYDWIEDPEDFSLLLSNGIVFISFFVGTGAMGFLQTKLD